MDGMQSEPVLGRLPEGRVADVRPTYFVTFLTGPVEGGLDDVAGEATYVFAGARDVIAVIAWAQQHLPDRLLLAEVSVQPYGSADRARVWSLQPDSPWARAEGPDYTY
ncbi:hypothetical protein [Cellulomonas persica]|uniref:Uncharacterized protein n=1 Tax=Cellulomonas persica TaxID=76861 RepID=A0A510URG2_9CELL|nr:hypothetical protein [Cellulomonas persica]GEK17247.1 hypothetical protein CPE01_09800 [Cellulomonas persica]